ncbi:MAG TPA: bifunctional nuclease family protein [Chloroflexota bacterium]|nr:bifunctional nuclease family protein [Chloroflexota bacterium]
MLVRCFVESVRINLANNSRVVILKDSKIERYLLIWIGETESYAIASELQGAHYERPLTHDLLYTITGRLGAEVTEIVINNLEGDVFYALITLQQGGTTLQIDARPSDAIALAVRAGAPIYVEEDVMAQAALTVSARPEEEDKLGVFRDFVNQLDF